MILVGVTERPNMIKDKIENRYIKKNSVIVPVLPIVLLSLLTMSGFLLSLPGVPTVVYGTKLKYRVLRGLRGMIRRL
jgi:hypothetical protein